MRLLSTPAAILLLVISTACPSYSYPPEWLPDVAPYPGVDVPDTGPQDASPGADTDADTSADTDAGPGDDSGDAGYTPTCGDGLVEEPEECDDGNLTDGDGCDSNCLSECGDGLLQEDSEEACDDGNRNDGDGCSARCALEEGVCSGALVDLTPLLHEGSFSLEGTIGTGAGDDVLFSCSTTRGLSVGHALFVREPSHLRLRATLSSRTQFLSVRIGSCAARRSEWLCYTLASPVGLSIPANTQLWIHVGTGAYDERTYELSGELLPVEGEGGPCGDGAHHCGAGLDCVQQEGQHLCKKPICGDGIQYPSEGCDDPEDAQCMKMACHPGTRCGDGKIDGDEECDDGNESNRDTCSNDCRSLACGDGILQPGEECDDGNWMNGDGCSSECSDELGVCSPARVPDLTYLLSDYSTFEETADMQGVSDLIEPSCLPLAPSLPDKAYRLVTSESTWVEVKAEFAAAKGTLSIRLGDCYTSAVEQHCRVLQDHDHVAPIQLPPHSTAWLVVSAAPTVEETPNSFSLAIRASARREEGEPCDPEDPIMTRCVDGLSCVHARCGRIACGDGYVSEGEACDPPDGRSCDEHCLFVCGDGISASQYQECDDGNNLDGDGCSADCWIEWSENVCSGGPIVSLAPLGPEGTFRYEGTTAGGPDLLRPSSCGDVSDDDGPDVVFFLGAVPPGVLTLGTEQEGNELDLLVSVRKGNCYNDVSHYFQCVDFGTGDNEISRELTRETTRPLWLIVHGRNGSAGKFTLSGRYLPL